MLRRLLLILVILPISVVLVMLAVANRQRVDLVVNPLGGEGALAYTVPLFAVVFGALILGVILGGVAVWFGQWHYRREARHAAREAREAHVEAEKLRADLVRVSSPVLPAPSGAAPLALPVRRDAA